MMLGKAWRFSLASIEHSRRWSFSGQRDVNGSRAADNCVLRGLPRIIVQSGLV